MLTLLSQSFCIKTLPVPLFSQLLLTDLKTWKGLHLILRGFLVTALLSFDLMGYFVCFLWRRRGNTGKWLNNTLPVNFISLLLLFLIGIHGNFSQLSPLEFHYSGVIYSTIESWTESLTQLFKAFHIYLYAYSIIQKKKSI